MQRQWVAVVSKGLLDPESEDWRRQNLKRFGVFTPHPGAEPMGFEGDESRLIGSARGWKKFLAFNLLSLAIIAGLVGLFVLFLTVTGLMD